MKASILHSQQQQQLFHMVPAKVDAGMGCADGGIQGASRFQQNALPTVFSEPESELTSNLSGSRKRPRDEGRPSSNISYHHPKQLFLLQKQLLYDTPLPAESIHVNKNPVTSTSGRPPLLGAAQPSIGCPGNTNSRINTPQAGSFSSGLISTLHHHSLEIDALIRLHVEQLRSGLDDARKRQYVSVVAALKQQVQRRVAEKQAELVAAANKNAELAERLRQAAAESQTWLNVARNSEAVAIQLRAGIEQALLQKLNGRNNNGDRGPGEDLSNLDAIKEGYGDSEEEGNSAAAGSCSTRSAEANEPSVGRGCFFPCKSCSQADACVLILPCRHLCLCSSCEHPVNECPVCGRQKNASMQINFS